jgi:hypothetical protein
MDDAGPGAPQYDPEAGPRDESGDDGSSLMYSPPPTDDPDETPERDDGLRRKSTSPLPDSPEPRYAMARRQQNLESSPPTVARPRLISPPPAYGDVIPLPAGRTIPINPPSASGSVIPLPASGSVIPPSASGSVIPLPAGRTRRFPPAEAGRRRRRFDPLSAKGSAGRRRSATSPPPRARRSLAGASRPLVLAGAAADFSPEVSGAAPEADAGGDGGFPDVASLGSAIGSLRDSVKCMSEAVPELGRFLPDLARSAAKAH